MSGLISRLKTLTVQKPGSKSRAQRGAVIVLVAILFGSGVLIGMVSLVVDSGQLLLEKTITQISADNVASALAHHCAANTSECTSTISANNSLVAISRSTYSKHPPAIISVCGNPLAVTLHSTLATCAGFTGIPRDCVTPSASYAAYVRVYTGYTAATGGTPLFPLLNNLIHGTSSNPSIMACSQAAWGTVSAVASNATAMPFPIAVSLCTALDSTIVGKKTPLSSTDTVVEGLLGGRNTTTSTTCAGKKDQNNSTVVYPSGAQFVAFDVINRPNSGKISIGDTLTENALWNASTVTTYQRGLQSMITSKASYLIPVVTDTRVASKVVVGFVAFQVLAYKYYLGGPYSYYPTTASTSFPTRAQNTCSNFCLVGAISNATTQSASLFTTSGTLSYNLGVNTIRPLQ
jgi:hypothetical protein